jgi:hypothetical protein
MSEEKSKEESIVPHVLLCCHTRTGQINSGMPRPRIFSRLKIEQWVSACEYMPENEGPTLYRILQI